MKFARGLAVVSMLGASVPLAAACGSAPDPNLFSQVGNGSSYAGGNNAHAGTHAGGNEDSTAGSSSGSGGSTSGGAFGGSNGSSGAPAGGTSSSEGGETSDAGEAGAAFPRGGAAGTSAGTAGVSGSSPGGAGAGGSSAGGAGAGGAAVGGGASGGTGAGGASVGGAGAGGTSTGGASAGGAGAGGTGSGGASVGGAGAGGAGGASSCPALAPADKTACNVSTPSSCFYPGVACSCLGTSEGPAATRKWACYGTPEKCPSAKPTAGNSCKQNLGAECPYSNQDYCVCKGAMLDASWVCQAPTATCMTNKPPQNLACAHVRSCQYSDVSCFCDGNNWSCLGG